MPEETTAKKSRPTLAEADEPTWRSQVLTASAKATELLISGIITGLGVAWGQSIHKRLNIAKKGADVHRMKVV